MFIDILGYCALNREIQEDFQHFRSILNFCFQKGLTAILILYIKYIYQL